MLLEGQCLADTITAVAKHRTGRTISNIFRNGCKRKGLILPCLGFPTSRSISVLNKSNCLTNCPLEKSVDTLGYCRMTLRDKDEILVAFDILVRAPMIGGQFPFGFKAELAAGGINVVALFPPERGADFLFFERGEKGFLD